LAAILAEVLASVNEEPTEKIYGCMVNRGFLDKYRRFCGATRNIGVDAGGY
jgi:hypothetical protein